MKQTRKFLALVLALTMILGLAVSVSADSITINGALDGATYNGYQILNLSAALKGTCGHGTDPEHDANCYNLSYTLNSKYETILKNVTSKTTEAEILAYIGAMSSDSEAIRTFADTVYAAIKAAGLDPDMVANNDGGTDPKAFENSKQGYWLIEEVMPGSHDEADHSLVMLTTMGIRDITVNTKRDNVELDKEVYHDDRASWDIVGDDQIGDTVYFHTKSHVPDTDGFTELFVYVIHDKMSTGLTSNVVTGNTNGDVTITINAADGTALAPAYYDVYAGNDANGVVLGTYTDDLGATQTKTFGCTHGCTFHVIVDIKAALAASVIDDDDVLYVNYSAILNEDATVYQAPGDHEKNQARVEYSNNPYDESETTETPWDETFEYTFQLNVKKTDAVTDAVIQGAKFVLSSTDGKKGTDFDSNKDGTLENTDTLYRFIRETVSGKDTYTIAPAGFTDADLAAGQTLTYVIEAGEPVIKGLDDSTDYYLYETVAPAGYNAKTTATRIKVFVEYNADGTVKDGFPKAQVDSTEQSSNMEVVIENSTGTVMPSTGGIGTTLFYVLGGMMAAGAAVLLVTKKRMAV